MAQPTLRPQTGFCLQAQSTGSPPGRWFINMTKHKLVEMPVSYSGQKVSKEWILQQGLGCLQVPFDMGSFRKVKGERAEGARQTTWAIDAVFNPLIIQLFMDDAFCDVMAQFRTWVINLTLKRIEESINVKLSASSIKLVKEFRYKDGESGDSSIAREFMPLPDEKDCFDAEMPTKEPEPKPEQMAEPLIEDVTPGIKKKPAMKKGFLNSGKTDLYGPEGSKEGVLPENAGDPLGYIPKKLRQQCKIVDCNSPDYQANQKKAEEAKKMNDMNADLRNSLLADMEKWSKKSQQDQWEADMPDGTEPAKPAQKYDNDYSRFDSIDVEDEKETETRDYYFDHNGVPRKLDDQSQSKATSSTAGKQQPAVKKGFLDDVKKALYPEGSSQAKAPMPDVDALKNLTESDLLAQMANMGPEEKALMDDFRSMLEGSSKQTPPSKQEAPRQQVEAKAPTQKAPEFTLSEVSDGLQLIIQVPELESMKGVDLDVTERRASVAFPAAVGLKPLQVELPGAVIPTGVRAKFSKKTRQITVSLPAASAQGGA
eukprot:TRINITY_DN61895_c0_g1_i1.p1 TRINITY_DN61895_c0_g1~~TRINITY_DN61895_c0_g1_i1.p1  ORF type:complete len:540 (+),score=166.51 TRINITY_DN61895_c0_g1_i1:71-1690(+)